MITLLCLQCGGGFEVTPYRKDSAHYCSRKCADASPESKKVKSAARIGLKLSAEHRKNIGVSKAGKKYPGRKLPPPFTDAHKQAISEAQKRIGNVPPSSKGVVRSLETRARMSKAKTGTTFSDEAKMNMSIAQLKLPHIYWLGKKRESMTGNKHFAWKGTTPTNKMLRMSFEYREWRKFVFSRDDYTCQFCSQRGGELEADHIIPFQLIIDKIKHQHGVENLYENALSSLELFNTSNGRTLCVPCHKKTDTYGVRWKGIMA